MDHFFYVLLLELSYRISVYGHLEYCSSKYCMVTVFCTSQSSSGLQPSNLPVQSKNFGCWFWRRNSEARLSQIVNQNCVSIKNLRKLAWNRRHPRIARIFVLRCLHCVHSLILALGSIYVYLYIYRTSRCGGSLSLIYLLYVLYMFFAVLRSSDETTYSIGALW